MQRYKICVNYVTLIQNCVTLPAHFQRNFIQIKTL